MRLAQLLQYFRDMNPTIPASETLPPCAPISETCPSGFESYLAILGISKAALNPAKLPRI